MFVRSWKFYNLYVMASYIRDVRKHRGFTLQRVEDFRFEEDGDGEERGGGHNERKKFGDSNTRLQSCSQVNGEIRRLGYASLVGLVKEEI